jgi:hypothetical protein
MVLSALSRSGPKSVHALDLKKALPSPCFPLRDRNALGRGPLHANNFPAAGTEITTARIRLRSRNAWRNVGSGLEH